MSDTDFKWLSLGAGGSVTGISFSDDKVTRLVRTDGNGFVWVNGRWKINTLTDAINPSVIGTDKGVDGICAAPSDNRIAYMVFSQAIFKSTDGGLTWPTQVMTGIVTAPNDNFRWLESRIEVDPSNADVVYFGSRTNGLYWSRDGGTTWTHVDTAVVPVGPRWNINDNTTNGNLNRKTYVDGGITYAQNGVSSVVVDRSSPVINRRHQTVYANVYGTGIYRSVNGGDTWAFITGSDALVGIYDMKVAPDGSVICTHLPSTTTAAFIGSDTRLVSRWNGTTWTAITPTGGANRAWLALGVDPMTSGRVLVVGAGGYLALTMDYGATWTRPARVLDSTGDIPWLAWSLGYGTGHMSPNMLQFDPVVAGRVWFPEGIGLWYADLPSTPPASVTWHSQSRGIEQLVVNWITVPPGGKPLMACWDRPIFRSVDADTYPEVYGPSSTFESAWDLDWSLTDPNYVVANVANHNWPNDPRDSGYSTDGGVTWTPFPTIPLNAIHGTDYGFGAMAVSTPGNVVWAPAYSHQPYYTTDSGTTWNPVNLPGVSSWSGVNHQQYYTPRHGLCADRVNPDTFYLFDSVNGVYRTTDKGVTWTRMSTSSPFAAVDSTWSIVMKAHPTRAGELYWAPGSLGGHAQDSFAFKKSTNGGATWTGITNVTGVQLFGFGKPVGTSAYNTVFIMGNVSNVYGLWRSTDDCATWTYLGNSPAGFAGNMSALAGDPNIEGRVYLGTSEGVIYGDLAPVSSIPAGAVTKLYVGDKLVIDLAPLVGLPDELAVKADLVTGKVPDAELPRYTGAIWAVANQAAMLALSGAQKGDLAARSDGVGTFMLAGDGDPTGLSNWVALPSSATAPLTDVAATATVDGALVVGKHNPVDATSGNRTMTLADATAAGKFVTVSKKDSSANTVSVSVTHLRDTGAATVSLAGQFESLMLVSKADGSWWPIADHKTKSYLDATYARQGSQGRTDLGLGTAATSAATAFAQTANNLSDLASASTARTNLGLGTAATATTGTSSGNVPLLGTGGRLAIAQIASGTPNGTKFVRDDGTLVTPDGASPPDRFAPTDYGLITWVCDPALLSGQTITGGSGSVRLSRVKAGATTAATKMHLESTTTGTSITLAKMAVFDSTGAQLGVTADFSASLGTAGAKTISLTGTTRSLVVGETLWLAMIQIASTAATMRAMYSTGNLLNLNLTGATLRSASITGQSDMVGSITPASLSANTSLMWLALS